MPVKRMIESVYLASRFGRREELSLYATDLRERGFVVTSSWLGRSSVDAMDVEESATWAAQCAREDIDDIDAADLLIAFSDRDSAHPSHGGYHTEIGYALALGMPIALIGPRLNVFHYLADIEGFDDWPLTLDWIAHVNA